MSNPIYASAGESAAPLDRRGFLRYSGISFAGLLAAGAVSRADEKVAEKAKAEQPEAAREKRPYPAGRQLAPVNAVPERIIKETVGLRPFRETGPNLSVQRLGNGKTLVHHYGHGGSGWSLSWGTAHEVVGKAAQTGDRHVAVIGCGVIGMTTATLLQRAGKEVRIYTKERQPNVTSSWATGIWSPYSRICLEEHGTPKFADWWAKTAAHSFRSYQDRVGLPNRPVEWVDGFSVSNKTPDERKAEREARPGPKFASFGEALDDVVPGGWELTRGSSPFAEKHAYQSSRMIFNIPAYSEMLMSDFYRAGGRLEYREFHSADEIAALPERTIINCTGLGAQKLFGDKKMVPVRGQLTFLIPQPEVDYQFGNDEAYIIPRQDGIVVGASQNGLYGSTDTRPDRQQSLDAVAAIQRSMAALRS